MTDRELIELAARAAGIEYGADRTDCGISITGKDGRHIHFPKWNPLTDPGDALRLAVELRLRVEVNDDSIVIGFPQSDDGETPIPLYEYPPSEQDDEYTIHHVEHLAATMRAIVRAAAEIGRAKT